MALTLTEFLPAVVGADGGYQLRILGDFSGNLSAGYRVFVGPTGTDADTLCWSGVPGRPTTILPLNRDELRCYTPYLAPGAYQVFVKRAADLETGLLAGTLRYMPKSFKTLVHATRSVMPPPYLVGARAIEDEGDANAASKPGGHYQAILDAVADADNEIGGLQQTRLTSTPTLVAPLGPPFTWDGTDEVAVPDTSGVSVGDWIQLAEGGRPFQILSIDPNVKAVIDVSEQTPPTGPGVTTVAATLTWNGTTTVTTVDTSELYPGLWIRLDGDGQWFQISSVAPNISVALANPFALTIPSGATQSSSSTNPVTELVTTTIAVETTLGWPEVGRIAIGGVAYAYASKSLYPAEFHGLTYVDQGETRAGLKYAHVELSPVTDISRAVSALELLRRAMLVEYAEGEDLNVLGRNLGVLRTPFLESDDIFREIVKAFAYNPKGTLYGIELLLDAMVGPGNYAITEDLINHPNTVFIELFGGPFVTDGKEGKAFLVGPESQLRTSSTTVDIDYPVVSRGHVRGVTWKNEDFRTDCRAQKPSAQTLVEYTGDPGFAPWLYLGSSEATYVTQLANSEGVEIQTSGSTFSFYRHGFRVEADSYVSVNMTMMVRSVSSLDITNKWAQWGLNVSDSEKYLGWGVLGAGVGNFFLSLTSGFYTQATGASLIFLALDQYYDVELRKYGREKVELWIDGALVDVLPMSAFAANVSRVVQFGVLDPTAPNVQGRIRHIGVYSRNILDFWNARGNAGTVATATGNRLVASLSDFVSGDVGKRLEIRGGTARNAQNGLNNGIFEVAAFVSATTVDLEGERQTGGSVSSTTPLRFTAGPRDQAFRFPDDLGKALVISGSAQGNDGTYVIDKLLDDQSLMDLESYATELPQTTRVCEVVAATFVSEAGITWRLDPDFVDESSLSWELSDAGAYADPTLTLRQATATPSSPVNLVFAVTYAQVLSAQILLDLSVANELLQELPDLIYQYYPVYLSDPLGFIRAFLDAATAAGVIPEFIESF